MLGLILINDSKYISVYRGPVSKDLGTILVIDPKAALGIVNWWFSI